LVMTPASSRVAFPMGMAEGAQSRRRPRCVRTASAHFGCLSRCSRPAAPLRRAALPGACIVIYTLNWPPTLCDKLGQRSAAARPCKRGKDPSSMTCGRPEGPMSHTVALLMRFVFAGLVATVCIVSPASAERRVAL
jgi:hypothetical protein